MTTMRRRRLVTAFVLIIGGCAQPPTHEAPSPSAARVETPEVPHGGLPITGEHRPGLEPFDQLMTRFVQEHQAPGAALAIAKDGRIIYARGFGYADREANQPVRPDSLFRIASISKPVTAVAVMQLVEQGKLSLDDRMTDLLHVEPYRTEGAAVDERLKDVTVRHLLQHTAGWDRGKAFDPMLVPGRIAGDMGIATPAGMHDIIRYMFGQPLQFDPGHGYAYSNLGYCVLGRIIEKVTGEPYDLYVKKHVLSPLGIERMQLGRTSADGRARGEVVYYDAEGKVRPSILRHGAGEPVAYPYGAWAIEVMDAHGGWIASAIDLVKFGSAFNDPARCPVLGESSIAAMFARPEPEVHKNQNGEPSETYYACGWAARRAGDGLNTWHAGLLGGTSTLLVRRHDGLCWAVLFNSDRPRGGRQTLSSLIDPLLHQAAGEVKQWPNE